MIEHRELPGVLRGDHQVVEGPAVEAQEEQHHKAEANNHTWPVHEQVGDANGATLLKDLGVMDQLLVVQLITRVRVCLDRPVYHWVALLLHRVMVVEGTSGLNRIVVYLIE